MTELTWCKSSLSTDDSECVELAPRAGAVAIRDSKDPHGGTLLASRDAWAAFVAAASGDAFGAGAA